MKIMSFNLRHSIIQSITGYWLFRYRNIVKYLNKDTYDIIGTQEVTRFSKRYLKKHMNNYNVIGEGRGSFIFTNEYNVILINKKYEITKYKTYSLSNDINVLGTKLVGYNFPRICSVVHFKDDKHKYLVINTHIDNSTSDNKKKMLDILEKILKLEREDDELVIITGDFNMSMNKKIEKFISNNKLKNIFKDNEKSSFVKDDNMRRIDHIFVSNKFKIKDSYIDYECNNNKCISDHYSIVGEISL